MKNIKYKYYFKKRDEREPRAEKHANEMEPAAAEREFVHSRSTNTSAHENIVSIVYNINIGRLLAVQFTIFV
jgi:hypothetical protein